jgi:hypothetical protein
VWLPTAQCFRPSSARFLLCFLADCPGYTPSALQKNSLFSALSECVCTLDLFLGITASLFLCIFLRIPQLQVPCASLFGSARLSPSSSPFIATQLCAALCRIRPHSAALCRIRPLSAALCRFLLHPAALRRSPPYPPYPPHSTALCFCKMCPLLLQVVPPAPASCAPCSRKLCSPKSLCSAP